jgi:hypothetical protein
MDYVVIIIDLKKNSRRRLLQGVSIVIIWPLIVGDLRDARSVGASGMIAGCNGDLYLGSGSSASRLLRVFAGRAGAWERRAAGFGAVARWVVAVIGVSPAVSGGSAS